MHVDQATLKVRVEIYQFQNPIFVSHEGTPGTSAQAYRQPSSYTNRILASNPPPRHTPAAAADLRSRSFTIRGPAGRHQPSIVQQCRHWSCDKPPTSQKAKPKPYAAIHQRRPVHTHEVCTSITQHVHYRRKKTSSVLPFAFPQA